MHSNGYIAMIQQEIKVAQSSQTLLLSTLCDDCHLLARMLTLQASDTDIPCSPKKLYIKLLKCLCSKVTIVAQVPVELQNITTQWEAAVLRLFQQWRLQSVSGFFWL